MTTTDKLIVKLFHLTNNDRYLTILGIVLALVGLGAVIFYNVLVGVCILFALPVCTWVQNFLHTNYIRILKS